jgi:CheY-like chemotaxis protein
MSAAKRILVIDDEEHIRQVAALSLEVVGGWEVLTAGSGGEGVAAAAAHGPDAILCDVMMPGMDGPSTVGELRSREVTRDIPVILLTAKVQPADRRRFAELDVTAVLAKPFDPLTLAAEVRAALGWEP